MQNIFLLIRQKCRKINGAYVVWIGESSKKNKWFFMQINYFCICYVLFVDIFTRSSDDFISMKFLTAVFLPASPFIPTSPFINFGDFCQPPRLLHLPRLLFWLKLASLPVYSALPFYLKLESTNVTVLFMKSIS